MRAAVYARVSLDPRGEGRSVSEQEAECRTWAEREGWDVVEVITETGSASRYARSTKARTRWDELANLVASGRIDILLTWEASRATRQLEEYAALRNVCAKHGVLWGYSGTVYDLTQRADRFRTGLDALVSEDESARTSERIRRASRARAVAGTPHGKLPFGYRREYDTHTGALLRQVPDEPRVEAGAEVPGTAPVAREIIRRVADGDTLYSIAADLTERGVPLPRPATKRHDAAAWIPTTVKRIASSPVYAGQRVHRGEVIGPAQWEALVDDETWQRAQAALEQAKAGVPRVDRSVKWLLSGIARCGVCGGPMVHHVNRGSSSYTCKHCTKVNRLREPVDQLVVELLMRMLADIDITPSDDEPEEITQATAELDQLQARRTAFIEQAADGSIGPATLARVEARLTPQIEKAEARLRSLRRPARLARLDLSDPPAMWERMSIGERRALLADAVEVTIHPAGRGRRTFNPDLIDVRPRW